MVVEFLEINQGNFRRLLNLADNFLCEIVKVLFGVHKLLKIDHRIEVAHDEKFVLASTHVDSHLVHRDILRISAVGVFLHLRIVFLKCVTGQVEREGRSFLNVVEEIPRGGRICVFFLSQALHFGGGEHFMETLVVGVFTAFVVSELEHTGEGSVCVENLTSSDQGQALRKRFEDFEPPIKGLFRSLLAKEGLLVEQLNFVSHNGVEEDAEDDADYQFVHLGAYHVLACLVHVVREEGGVRQRG